MADILQNKRKVYALGETVLDLVSNDGITFLAVPGGSVLNASVSLGRMDVDVSLLSEFGADKTGDLISNFLKKNHVTTEFCLRHSNSKTSIALAFLDSNKNASYSFYHDVPEAMPDIEIPAFCNDDILLFGSFYAVKPNRRHFLLKILQKAVEARSVIYYDLNIRAAHAAEMDTLLPSFLNNISVATVVKGSDEDFFQLFGLTDPEAVYERVKRFCAILIITNGAKPLHIFTPLFSKSYAAKSIIPVSTVGAGDNFNAGFVYGLTKTTFGTKQLADIQVTDMDKLVGCGLAFATETCLSNENYIKGDFKTDFWKKYI